MDDRKPGEKEEDDGGKNRKKREKERNRKRAKEQEEETEKRRTGALPGELQLVSPSPVGWISRELAQGEDRGHRV